ncbi:hypothetical protein J7354_01565 [Sulfitobacter sp. R18_2]|uniref:hypothetical protein n=1 Tax=Sulfitobacter sp. R18_2 TaxID=2821105 RepID=UPI001ADB7AE1|nr:hypothetical protein [Sulfitobacter sp. R18_2]MBO9437338.1 hypothetical protein [Sulfitobacter sp. R18_2]
MAVEIGALRALLSLDSAAFDKGAKRAQASMNGLQRSLHRTSQKMRSIGKTMTKRMTLPLAGVAAVAVKSSLSTIDAQSKMAQSLNTSTRSMQVLERAADRAGISTGELEQVGRQLTKRLSQIAATGKGPAAGALEKIGLKAADLADMDLDQKIAVINRAIRDMVPEAEQAAVSMALFGDRAGIMAGRLDADTIATASDEIDRFGIAVSEVDADKIEEANDAISAIGLVTRGLANQIAVALAPTLKTIAERIADVGHWFSSLSPEVRKFIGIGAALAAVIGPLAIALGFVAAGMAALASPIGLVVLAFGAVVGVAAAVAANWDTLVEKYPLLQVAVDRLTEAFDIWWKGVKKNFEGVLKITKGAVKTIVALFDGDLTTAIDGMKQVFEGWKAIITNSFDSLLSIAEAIVPGFKQAVSDIIDTVSGLPGKLKQWGIDAVQGFVDGIIEKWNELKAKVKSIFSFKDVNAETAAAGRAIGRDLGAGIGVGLDQSAPDLEQRTRDYINSVEDAARDESETQSPSRVWMRLGRDLMDGLGVGIADGAQSAAASAAAAANQVTAAASAAQPALNTMPDTLRESTSEANTLGNRLSGMFSSAAKGASSFSDFLGNIANQLSNMFMDQAFQAIFGGGSGGGSGLFGTLMSSIGIPGFANGTNYAPGGLAMVGERGPELVNLPRGSRVIPNNRLSGNGGGQVDVRVYVDQDGNWQSAVERISGNVSAKVTETKLAANNRAQADNKYLSGGR